MPNTLTEQDPEEIAGEGRDLYNQIQVYIAQGGYSNAEISLINEVRYLYHLASIRTASAARQPGSFVFKGGHVELRDGGEVFRRWRAGLIDRTFRGGDRTGSSSHVTDVDQYEIVLPNLGVILFGTRDGHTWFQNEAHAMTQGTSQQILHGTDFVSHAVSGFQQVGALGYSPHSEKKGSQLIFAPDKPKLKRD